MFVDGLSAETSFEFLKTFTPLSLEGFICKNFTDSVLFSSGYTQKKKGSNNYEVWEVGVTCEEAGGKDCLLHNIHTKSRVLYLNPFDEGFVGEGYVQISELEARLTTSTESDLRATVTRTHGQPVSADKPIPPRPSPIPQKTKPAHRRDMAAPVPLKKLRDLRKKKRDLPPKEYQAKRRVEKKKL